MLVCWWTLLLSCLSSSGRNLQSSASWLSVVPVGSGFSFLFSSMQSNALNSCLESLLVSFVTVTRWCLLLYYNILLYLFHSLVNAFQCYFLYMQCMLFLSFWQFFFAQLVYLYTMACFVASVPFFLLFVLFFFWSLHWMLILPLLVLIGLIFSCCWILVRSCLGWSLCSSCVL